VFDELKALLVKGDGWPFIMCVDSTRNGRAAFMALKTQCAGNAQSNLRKTKAYSSLQGAKYTGARCNFNFTHYVAIHQKAHNELLEEGEEVPASKKVTDFLAGIAANSDVGLAKPMVYANPEMLNNFDAAQTFLSNFASTSQVQAKLAWDVAPVNSTGGPRDNKGPGGNKRKGGPSGRKPGGGKRKIHAGSYSPKEWAALSNEEKEKVRELRKKKPGPKRDVAAVESDPAEESEQEEPMKEPAPSKTSAGSSFGKNAHKKKS